MSQHARYANPRQAPPQPYYDPMQHGIVDPRGGFRPNINAHAVPSKVDAAATAAGTNATGPSAAFKTLQSGQNPPGWDKTFHGPADFTQPMAHEVAGVANPPPMNNLLPGQANAASLATTQPVRPSTVGAPLTGPGGNAKTDAANLANARAVYAPHDPANRVAAVPAAPRGGGVNSEGIQMQLDKAAGTPLPDKIPSSGTSITTPNGTASVRFADPRDGGLTPKIASQPILGGDGKQIGVGRQTLDDMRAATFKAHPEVFTEGSPQNQAFVAHAQRYGEPAAHSNVDSLMSTFRPANTAGATSATVKNDIPSAPKLQPGLEPGATKPGMDIAQQTQKAAAIQDVQNDERPSLPERAANYVMGSVVGQKPPAPESGAAAQASPTTNPLIAFGKSLFSFDGSGTASQPQPPAAPAGRTPSQPMPGVAPLPPSPPLASSRVNAITGEEE